ncbi:MAG: discoidin domain-containing protein [Prevotellaceae bacterium]|nr:discoidin domain-containing protein [Prevotellaceae bacterium]
MRKFLSLIALLLIAGATWNAVDARYTLGTRKAYNEINVGDIIAIQGISDAVNHGYRYIADGKLQTAFTEECVYKVEEGPADLRTGEPTYFLRQLAQDKYFGMSGLRGDYYGGGTRLVSTTDSAFNFALYCAADSSIAWNGQENFDANSTVFCYSYYNKEEDELSYSFICNWGLASSDPTYIWVWQYNDTNCWDVYEANYADDIRGDLEDLIEYYESLNLEYPAGNDPGFYPTDLVEAFDKVKADAILALNQDRTDEEYQQCIDNLKAAKEALDDAAIDITEGYYYVVSAYPDFLNSQKVEKGIYVDGSTTYLQWKNLDETNAAFIFKFTKLTSGNFNVQSFATKTYWNASSSQANSQNINTSSTPNYEQIFTNIGNGQWQIHNTYYTTKYHPANHSNGSGKSGNIVTWNTTGTNTQSTWYLRSVDQSIVDSLESVLVQQQLTSELNALCKEANSVYNGLFVFKADTDNPLITHVTDGDPDDCQLSSNASDPTEGQHLSYLIDGDATTFWHSTYNADNDPKTYHYLQADISNNPQTFFQIYYMRRSGTYGNYDRPTKVNVYAAADTTGQWEGKAQWKLVKVLDGMPTSDAINEYYSPGIELDEPASYIRFEVIEKSNYPSRALNGYPYFNLAEFQIYPTVLDEDASQYYYAEGMKDAADALLELLNAAQAKVAANTATQEDIDALTAAIEGVDALYADTTLLVNLINSATRYLNGVVVGDAIGNINSQDAIDAFETAIAKAIEAKPTGNKISKAALDAAYNELRASVQDFLHSINLPDSEHWYYMTSLDTTRNNNEANYTHDGYMYVADYGANKGVVWALNENEKFTYNPFAMWHFIPVEDEDYSLTYYIQNLGSGLYIGDYPTYSQPVMTSKTPVLYRFNLNGGELGLIATKGENPGYSLHAANADNAIVGWSAGGGTASAWAFTEVDPNEIESIVIPAKTNNIDVFTLPYEYSYLADYNVDLHTYTYAIKSMTLDKDTDVTTIELYEKDEFAAGEPCILVTGDPTNEASKDTTLTAALPTQVTSKSTPANGLVGLLTSEIIPDKSAWFTGKEITNRSETVTINAHTGYIDTRFYEGEVEGVETALTLQIAGIPWTNEPTGVKGAVTVEDIVNAIKSGAYTISGQKVAAPQKGHIYIIDGKKVKY